MRSSHVDLYNHDEDAATYDQGVIGSGSSPVRRCKDSFMSVTPSPPLAESR